MGETNPDSKRCFFKEELRMNLINPFVPNAPFFYPRENIMTPLQSKWACHRLGETLLRQNFNFENIQDDLFGIWKKIKTSARMILLINK